MMRAGGPAAGAVEPALPPADAGVPLGCPIEELGAQVEPGPVFGESMTQRKEGDETMEQTVDEEHGAGAALGAPFGSQDSEGNDIYPMRMAVEEEEEAAAAARRDETQHEHLRHYHSQREQVAEQVPARRQRH